MKTIYEALKYEVKSHWLASYISFGWGQEIIAWWIASKVKRKWKRYMWAEEMNIKSKSSEVTVKMSTEFHKKLGEHLQEFLLTPEEFNESIYPMNKAMMDKRYSGKHINLKELGIIEDETLNFGVNLNDSDDEDE